MFQAPTGVPGDLWVDVEVPSVSAPIESCRQITQVLRDGHTTCAFGLTFINKGSQGEGSGCWVGTLKVCLKAFQTGIACSTTMYDVVTVQLDQLADGQTFRSKVPSGLHLICLCLDLGGPVVGLAFQVKSMRPVNIAASDLRSHERL